MEWPEGHDEGEASGVIWILWSLVVLSMDDGEGAWWQIQVMTGGNDCATEGLMQLSSSGQMFNGGLLLRIHVMTGGDECTAEGGAADANA